MPRGPALQAGPWGFCVSAVSPPPPPHSCPFLVLIWRCLITRQPYNGQPVSAGTLLTDSPAQGWARERAGLPTSQSSPAPSPHPPRPLPAAPALVPRPLRGSPPSSMAAFPCGHQGAAILDMPSPSRWVTGPHLQGLTPPQPPLFLFKGTDCNLGAGTCLPPASGSPKARY